MASASKDSQSKDSQSKDSQSKDAERKDAERKGAEHSGETSSGVNSGTYDGFAPMDTATAEHMQQSLMTWIHPFSKLHRIPVFKRVWFYLALMTAYTTIVHFFVVGNVSPQFFKDAGNIAYTSLVLGLLLVFRTNSAYERWWEGRKLWGQLVNESRNLCLKVKYLPNVSEQDKIVLSEYVVSFAYSLKNHLRDLTPGKRPPGVKPQLDMASYHLPVQVADAIYYKIQEWYQAGKIDGFLLLQMDSHMRSFMDVCGACERIKSSPLVLSYRAFIRQGIAINLAAVPFYAATTLPLHWTLPIIIFASYFLIGLELIAEDIEDPFGNDGDDLPLDTICDKIRQVITQIMRENDGKGKDERLKYTMSSSQIVVSDPIYEHK
jgi:putative membrane protein